MDTPNSVDRPTSNRVTRRLCHGNRLAGDHAFVKVAHAICDFAVHGNALSGAHLNRIANPQFFDGQLNRFSIPKNPRRTGLQAQEFLYRGASASFCTRLQIPAD